MDAHNATTAHSLDEAYENLDTKIGHARAVADLIATCDKDDANVNAAGYALEFMLEEALTKLRDYRNMTMGKHVQTAEISYIDLTYSLAAILDVRQFLSERNRVSGAKPEGDVMNDAYALQKLQGAERVLSERLKETEGPSLDMRPE